MFICICIFVKHYLQITFINYKNLPILLYKKIHFNLKFLLTNIFLIKLQTILSTTYFKIIEKSRISK